MVLLLKEVWVVAESSLDDLKGSYEELVRELKKEQDRFHMDGDQIDVGHDSSPFDKFSLYEMGEMIGSSADTPLAASSVQNSSRAALSEPSRKHQGFFSWLMGIWPHQDVSKESTSQSAAPLLPSFSVPAYHEGKAATPSTKSELSDATSDKEKRSSILEAPGPARKEDVLMPKQDFSLMKEPEEDIVTKTDEDADFEHLIDTIKQNIETVSQKEQNVISTIRKKDTEQEGTQPDAGQDDARLDAAGLAAGQKGIEPKDAGLAFEPKDTGLAARTEYGGSVAGIPMPSRAPDEEWLREVAFIKDMQKKLDELESKIATPGLSLEHKDDALIRSLQEHAMTTDTKLNQVSGKVADLHTHLDEVSKQNMTEDNVPLKEALGRIKEADASHAQKFEAFSSELEQLKSSLPQYVSQSDFDKLRSMIKQIDVYIDTFDDRERELEKKYQENKALLSRMELFEVELRKQREDQQEVFDDLKSKVTFVYKYLQQVQNNIYVLSKSMELMKK